nr:uncharacterized protein LOC117223248 [Megalopta genalis]XP_033331337.1 uncharacterized protein LOC117223248 [Megalopta genalis]XP_033331339.1 uncharacterized protein LOC117223248 [Megalopta genalis]XP_033331340.1 uncharacterized protein LOC117223248 [Megalopta genalis]XP_033331341.1 uncharacterized protein LOC117223248 [Megalopta genalis]
MCKAVHLVEDVASVRACINIIFAKMQEMLSFCALREGSNEMVGVLIASKLDRNQMELKLKPSQGDAIHQIANVKYYAITEALFYENVDAEKLIHIDLLCVKPQHQKRGVGTSLVRSCIARAIKLDAGCVGEFTCDASQTIAERLGFEVYSEIPYKFMGWLHRSFERFETCQTENYSLVCIAMVPPPPRVVSLIIPPAEDTKQPPKRRNKNDKKKKKNKKNKKVKKR